jgi:hypothetical protein
MNRFLFASVSALTLLLAAGTGAQAGLLPEHVQWTYNFAPGAPAVLADGNDAAGVTFTNEPNKVAVGSSDIVVSNIRVFSAATAGAPDVLSANGGYTVALQLSTSDDSGVHTATLTFSGKLSGSFSAEHAQIANEFTGETTQKVMLGNYSFTVSMIAFTPPGPPDQTNAGSIAAHVAVENLTPAQVPEPSTMLLSGLGLTFLGGAAWRKRRQTRQAA